MDLEERLLLSGSSLVGGIESREVSSLCGFDFVGIHDLGRETVDTSRHGIGEGAIPLSDGSGRMRCESGSLVSSEVSCKVTSLMTSLVGGGLVGGGLREGMTLGEELLVATEVSRERELVESRVDRGLQMLLVLNGSACLGDDVQVGII